MKIFLYVVLGIVVGVPLALWLVWQFIKYKLRSVFGGFLGALKGMYTPEPARITLKPDDAAAPDSRDWNMWLTGLRGAGFKSVGTFTAKQLPDIAIHGFADESRSMYAAVYHKKPNVHADIASRFADGRAVTHTSMKPSGLDRPEWQTTVNLPQADAEALLRAHLAARPQAPLHPAATAAFTRDFEAEYARTMDWRLVRGVTEEEVRRAATLDLKPGDKPPSDDIIKSTVEAIRSKYDMELERFTKDLARQAAGYSDEAWEKLQHSAILITDKTTPGEVIETI